jgi:hypothetical protein
MDARSACTVGVHDGGIYFVNLNERKRKKGKKEEKTTPICGKERRDDCMMCGVWSYLCVGDIVRNGYGEWNAMKLLLCRASNGSVCIQ